MQRFAALVLIIILSPIWLSVMVASFILQGTPILFSQQRVGRGGKLFSILKFRSMEVDNNGAKVTADGDSRITPFGKLLRRTKLDEMPQLYNIFKGDMVFVGPRPEVPEYTKYYSDGQKKVLDRSPGLTDYASLAFREEESLMALASDPENFYVKEVLPAKIEINLQYNPSLLSDLSVILQTLLVVVKIKKPPFREVFARLEEKAGH